MAKIAIVGGGVVAGSSAALYLAKIGLDVTLFEKRDSLVNGPPFCHLHAGGNLYREISDDQCVTLLHQSIDLLRFYPHAVDFRPTVIVTPQHDDQDPQSLLPRLKLLQQEYKRSIEEDRENEVLGESSEYFKLYSKEELLALKEKQRVKKPTTLDEWMIPVVQTIDLERVKFPLIIVQEYGLNLFRLSASVTLSLQNLSNTQTLLQTTVTDVQHVGDQWAITYENDDHVNVQQFDYLINAAGFKTDEIDDMLGFKRQRFVEFKAAYVTKWDEGEATTWPEIIFHGKRGTPAGMGQFTPYVDGYFQLHGMTNGITLFDQGLVQSTLKSAQPQLTSPFIQKLDHDWTSLEVEERTDRAIDHLAQYIPTFSSAKMASKPLFGAQQIPGDDQELRAADVSFEGERYARCEVVKASSVLDMIDAVMRELVGLGFVHASLIGKRSFEDKTVHSSKVLEQAEELCEERGYPLALASITTPKKWLDNSL
jgi:glycine/D-amino acid oxidase-like deaminating enzyme